ncbi:MAG: PqqD family protein [Rhizomicrobium sp.]
MRKSLQLARPEPEGPLIGVQTRIERNASIMAAEVDGEIVMMNVRQGLYFGLDDIATDVWKRIASPLRFSDLIESLAATYDGSPETIAADVSALVGRMAKHGLVRLS